MKSNGFACAAVVLTFVLPADMLAGQRSAPNQAATGTQILMLGTVAGPNLNADRSQPATLLIVDGQRYLIDCGIGTARRLAEAGIGTETVPTIFLTHLHADHTIGLVDVLANDFQQRDRTGPNYKISIYGPPQTKALVDAAYHYISIPYTVHAAEGGGPQRGLPRVTPFAAHEIGEGVVYQDDKIRVVAAENSHYARMPQSSRAIIKSYSYRFETPHGTIVFTGDTGPNGAVVRLAEGADVLVSEVEDKVAIGTFVDRLAQRNHWSAGRRDAFKAHMTDEHLGFEEVGEMAAKAHVKSVVLYHWNPALRVTAHSRAP